MWKLQPSSDTLKHHHPLFNFYSDRVSSEFMGEKRTQTSDCITAQTYASSRWCPTPEQLRSLEEFYKRGIRTPSTYQIQQITAQLRRFGKIEGKNVFYWFQNHKARERQKIRRKLSVGSVMSKQLQGKSSKDVDEVQKNWALTLQEGVSIGRADTTEGERDGWIQLLLQKKDINRINNGISPSRYSHVTIDSHLVTSHSVQEDHHRLESRQSKKTLELFPVHGDEKANEGPVQFYEFL